MDTKLSDFGIKDTLNYKVAKKLRKAKMNKHTAIAINKMSTETMTEIRELAIQLRQKVWDAKLVDMDNDEFQLYQPLADIDTELADELSRRRHQDTDEGDNTSLFDRNGVYHRPEKS